MEKTLEKVKTSEEDAQTRINEARKHEFSKIVAAEEKAEQDKIAIDLRARKTVEEAIQAAEKKAMAEVDKIRGEQKEKNKQLINSVSSRLDDAIGTITEAFGSWQ